MYIDGSSETLREKMHSRYHLRGKHDTIHGYCYWNGCGVFTVCTF